MIIQRTKTPWTASAVLFRKSYKVTPYVVKVSVERCSRTLKIGAIFRTYVNDKLTEMVRYLFPPQFSYIDCINQVLATDYGYYTNNSRNN